MALCCDRFADNLQVLSSMLPYLQELGINTLNIIPILDCPVEHSDDGMPYVIYTTLIPVSVAMMILACRIILLWETQ